MLLLPAFAGAQEVPVNAARLSWVAPTARVDNTPLPSAEIQGYELFWSTSTPISTTTANSFIVSSISQYTIENLAPATWYFAVRTRTTDGLVSALSTTVSKTTTVPPPVEPLPPSNIEVQ